MAKNAIGFWRHKDSGCYYYRILQKMQALGKSGVKVYEFAKDADISDDIINDLHSFQFYGIYPFGFESVLKFLKEKGIKIVYDTDDALQFIDESNPHYYDVQKSARSFYEIVPFVDEFTVSTPKFIEYIRNVRPDAKITVIPNTYRETDWTFERPKREGIRIGYAASASHIEDLLLILPAIKNLQKKYEDTKPIRFILMGFGTDTYEKAIKDIAWVAPQKGKDIIKEVDRQLREIKFEWIPAIPFQQYFPTLINTALDFGVCPLQDTPFNHHRSAIKALEYTMAGALALATNLPPYWEDQTSVLLHNTQWESKLEFCINNPQAVADTKAIHLQWAKENRNVNNQIDLLKSVYVG